MEILRGLSSPQFDSLWMGNHNWCETPNCRRGGWSGVRKMEIELPEGKVPIYLKQQFRHSYRCWTNLFRKQPTALREYQNIKRLRVAGIPTVDVVMFAVKGDTAILGTRALEGYQALDQLNLSQLTIHQRRQLIRAIAVCIRKLHHAHYQHSCLYPKHIFVRQKGDSWSVKLIDLEKMRRRWSRDTATRHDLDTLYRRSMDLFNQRDRLAFLRVYLGDDWSRTSVQQLLLQLKQG